MQTKEHLPIRNNQPCSHPQMLDDGGISKGYNSGQSVAIAPLAAHLGLRQPQASLCFAGEKMRTVATSCTLGAEFDIRVIAITIKIALHFSSSEGNKIFATFARVCLVQKTIQNSLLLSYYHPPPKMGNVLFFLQFFRDFYRNF